MKSVWMLAASAALAVAPAAMAQKWEFGGGVGGGFYTSQEVTVPGASASAKIATSLAGSAWMANNGVNHWGGEIHFDYQLGNLQLNQGGTEASFGAHSYAAHYDVLWHFTPNGSKVRPFVAVGAGIKVYQGTGTEAAFQPLSNVALLTKAQDLTPLVSAGFGVKMQLTPHMQFRAEIHDYMTTFPKQVITPAQNGKVGGWLHDFVPTIGISYTSGESR